MSLYLNIGLIHFSDEACGLFSQLVWSLGQNFDAWSTAPINTPHPLKMGFSNSLINIRHFWYLKYSRGGTNSHIFLLQHKWVQCQIFFTFYLHTHLLFWRSWIDPVMKHLGVFTFRITSARHQAPGQARPWVGLQRFIFSHCHIPIFPAAMTGVWSVSAEERNLIHLGYLHHRGFCQ